MVVTRRGFPGENYLVAVLAVGLGVILRLPFAFLLGPLVPFLTFFPAVMLAAWRGGLGPGLLSTVLSAFAAMFLIMEPAFRLRLDHGVDAMAIALFVGVGTFISWLTGRMRCTADELRRTEEAERRLRLLSQQTLAGIGDAVISTDMDGRITFMNAAAEQLTGWRVAEVEGQPLDTVFRIVNEHTGSPVESPVTGALRDGAVRRLATGTELIARDGRHLPIDDSGAPIRDEQGRLVGAVLVFRDITVRRAAEREVQASREELRGTLESITDAFCALDQNWNITYVNRAAEQVTGRSRDELLGMNQWDAFPATRGTIVEECFGRAVAERRPVLFEHYYAPLSAWLETSAFPTIAGGLAVYFRDITGRKLAEQRDALLLALEDAMRPLTDAREIMQTAAELLGEHLHADRCAYVDVEPDERTFHLVTGLDRVVPSVAGRYTIAQFGEEFARLCRAGVPYVVENADADPRLADAREAYREYAIRAVVSVPLPKGDRFVGGMAVYQATPRHWRQHEVELVRLVGTRCWESIERARITRELEEREQRLHVMADAVPQIFWVTDTEGRAEFFNRQWSEYTGAPYEPTTAGEVAVKFVHPDDGQRTMEAFEAARSTGTTFQVEHRIRSREGNYRWFLVRAEPYRDPATGHIVRWFGSSTDIHERVLAKGKLEFLHRISEATREPADPEEVMVILTRLLGEHLHVSRCAYADVEADTNRFTILHDYTADGVASTAGSYELSLFGSRAAADQREGRTLVIRDVDRELADMEGADMFNAIGVKAIVCCPLLKQGKLTAMMAVHQTVPRDWTTDEVELVETTVERAWAYIERSRAIRTLRESEARFRAIVSQAADGIAQSDLLGRFTLINDRYCAITGRSREELYRMRMQDITHPDDLPSNLMLFQRAVETGEPFVIEKRYLRPDGSLVWVVNSVSLVRDASGGPQSIMAITHDVSQRKAAEAALRRSNEELARLNKELEEFAYVSAHDIQEPLRMVNAYTELLLRRSLVTGGDAEQYASFIRQGVARMEALIRDLLTYSRTIQREDQPVSAADLNKALALALTLMDERIRENRARVDVGFLPTVRGDAGQLAHVFQNLISNALKYRNRDVPPEIVIEAARQGDEWIVSVRDNGIGFEQRHASRIFGLFKRLHKDDYPGTGLGLAICKRIVERYGGRMWAKGRPGEGATFFFALPAAE